MASTSRRGPPGWNLDWSCHYYFYVKPRMFAAKKLMISCRKSTPTPACHQEDICVPSQELNERSKRVLAITHPETGIVILEGSEENITEQKEKNRELSTIIDHKIDEVILDKEKEENLQEEIVIKVKERKKAISIINPITGKDIFDDSQISTKESKEAECLQLTTEAAPDVPSTIPPPVSCFSVDNQESPSTFLPNSRKILQYSKDCLLELRTEILSLIQPSDLLNSNLLLEKTSCQICFEDFTSKVSLEGHLKNRGKIYPCRYQQSNCNWWQLQSHQFSAIKPYNIPNLDIVKNQISPMPVSAIPDNHPASADYHSSSSKTPITITNSEIAKSVLPVSADIHLDSSSQNLTCSNQQNKTYLPSPTVTIKVKKSIAESKPNIIWNYDYNKKQRIPPKTEVERQYDRDFLQLESQPLSMDLPNLDTIKNKKSYSSCFEDVTSGFSLKMHAQEKKNPHTPLRKSQQSNFEKIRQYYRDFLLLLLNHPLSSTELRNLLKSDFKKPVTEVSTAVASSNQCVPINHHTSQSTFLSNMCMALQYSRGNLLKIQTKILSTPPPSYLLNLDIFLKKTRCPVCFADFTSKIAWKRHMRKRKKTHSNHLNHFSDSQRQQYYKDFIHFLNHPSSFNESHNLPNSDIIGKKVVAREPAVIFPSISSMPLDNSQSLSKMLPNQQSNSEKSKFDKYDMIKYDREQFIKQKVSSTGTDLPTISLNQVNSLKRKKRRKRRCKTVSTGPRYLYYFCPFMTLRPIDTEY